MTDSNRKTTLGIARLAGVTLAAVLALALLAATTVSAEPEFKPTGGTFTGTSGESRWEFLAGDTITCTAGTSTGAISNARLVGGVVVEFTGCTSSSSTEKNCPVKSTNTATAGEIVTNTLRGVLGLVLPKGTGSGVGLLLLPITTKKFVLLEGNKCTFEGIVTGDVAGEVLPVGTLSTRGTLKFAKSSSSNESIKDIDLSTGGSVNPELDFFSPMTIEATASLTFSSEVEVS